MSSLQKSTLNTQDPCPDRAPAIIACCLKDKNIFVVNIAVLTGPPAQDQQNFVRTSKFVL